MKRKVTIKLKDLHLPISLQTSSEESYSTEEIKALVLNKLQGMCTNEESFKNHIKIKKAAVLPAGFLQKHELYPGRVVQTLHNEIGIITGIREIQVDDEKPISVVLSGHRIWYFNPEELFETAATFKEARCIRFDFTRQECLWHEGDSAYFNYKNRYYPVVIGKTARGITKIHMVKNDKSPSVTWAIERESLNRYLIEFKDDNEKSLYIPTEQAMTYYRLIMDKTKSENKILNRKQQLTIFQRALFDLQPCILENANAQLKTFILSNDEFYLKTVRELEQSLATERKGHLTVAL